MAEEDNERDEDKIFDEFGDYCEEVVKANQAWHARWPKACTKCEGAGGEMYTEMHGFKHGPGEQIFDICICIEHGLCPRCSFLAWPYEDDLEHECPTCHWNHGKGDDDAAPQI
jgi:hypothetical protein